MMNSPSTSFVPPTTMGIYEPFHQMEIWGENLTAVDPVAHAALIVEVDRKLDNQVMVVFHILNAFSLIALLVIGIRLCYPLSLSIHFPLWPYITWNIGYS
ncbi:hypothetical protein SAY86_025027 [Trapa natans]|uniref:Uncharacterized protein n=1 Tax=Trapa natans TaxID=22666 RepID=A0AAN7M7M0_TRANT|nr:hypothetical protein SAY86_025027 [Trapa natans]